MFNKTDPSYFEGEWTFEKTEHAILGLCKILDRYAHNLTLDDLQNDPRCAKIPDLSLERVQEVIADVEAKLWRGAKPCMNDVIYHTGPHHDDIMLGLMPFINPQLWSPFNQQELLLREQPSTHPCHTRVDLFEGDECQGVRGFGKRNERKDVIVAFPTTH